MGRWRLLSLLHGWPVKALSFLQRDALDGWPSILEDQNQQKPAPQNSSFTSLLIPSAFHAHASRRPLCSSKASATTAWAADGRRWWHHRGTSPVHARSQSCTHHCHGALCWPRARTRGISWQRRRLLVRWRRALGRAHQRRLRWAYFLIKPYIYPDHWCSIFRNKLSGAQDQKDLKSDGWLPSKTGTFYFTNQSAWLFRYLY